MPSHPLKINLACLWSIHTMYLKPLLTLLAVEMKVKGCEYPIFISTQCVSELHHIQLRDKGLQIGAACSFTEIAEEMKMLIAKLPGT